MWDLVGKLDLDLCSVPSRQRVHSVLDARRNLDLCKEGKVLHGYLAFEWRGCD